MDDLTVQYEKEAEARLAVNLRHAARGVRFIDPRAAYVDADAEIGEGTVVYPGVILEGKVKIGGNCVIGQNTRVKDAKIGDYTKIEQSVIVGSEIGSHSRIGPFAYIRPGSVVGDHTKVGNFVEVKNSTIGDGSKASHLTYIGDADVGERVNLGCGVVFVNYDGRRKHRSAVGNGAFVGCNVNLISPIVVGNGAYVAAGTTVTKDVPEGGLSIGRGKERHIEGWVKKRGFPEEKAEKKTEQIGIIDKKLKKREEIPPEYKWDIESMYPDEREWKKEYARAEAAAEAYAAEFAGKLSGSGGTLLAALRKKDALWLIVERLFVYAKMRRDEDNRNAGRQAMADRAQALIARVSADLSFFAPEFLAIPEETLRKFAEEEQCLGQYGHLVRTLLRQKEHVLPRAEEELLARLSDVTSATGEIFSMINEADMKFGAVTGEDGEETELTHGRYIGFMESRDRKVRREAFSKMYGAYIRQKNTLAATYRYNTKADTVIARIRGYSSSLEAALSGDNIPLSVYDSLIGAVNGRLGALHRYMDIRKKIIGVDELHMYDVYAPLVEREEKPVRYERAVEILRRGLSALGGDYVKRMERGLSERWVDVYENEGKTSGAYSFGSYDSKPYILLNYTGKLKDVFTLAHEMGHSMHSAFTRENQPFVYGGHSIFTAEVASTVNESLLMRHLLAETPDTAEKKYLLNLYIEEFRATLFRQAMFAEFEKLTHAAAERGESLTSDWLCGEYGRLNEKYFGPSVKQDEEIAVEWARIPHFYRAFYVYKYATGYSAAVAIADRILNEGEGARDAYIDFLKTGESGDPIDLLKIAGVDMSAPEPVERAIDTFEGLVDEMEKLFI